MKSTGKNDSMMRRAIEADMEDWARALFFIFCVLGGVLLLILGAFGVYAVWQEIQLAYGEPVRIK